MVNEGNGVYHYELSVTYSLSLSQSSRLANLNTAYLNNITEFITEMGVYVSGAHGMCSYTSPREMAKPIRRGWVKAITGNQMVTIPQHIDTGVTKIHKIVTYGRCYTNREVANHVETGATNMMCVGYVSPQDFIYTIHYIVNSELPSETYEIYLKSDDEQDPQYFNASAYGLQYSNIDKFRFYTNYLPEPEDPYDPGAMWTKEVIETHLRNFKPVNSLEQSLEYSEVQNILRDHTGYDPSTMPDGSYNYYFDYKIVYTGTYSNLSIGHPEKRELRPIYENKRVVKAWIGNSQNKAKLVLRSIFKEYVQMYDFDPSRFGYHSLHYYNTYAIKYQGTQYIAGKAFGLCPWNPLTGEFDTDDMDREGIGGFYPPESYDYYDDVVWIPVCVEFNGSLHFFSTGCYPYNANQISWQWCHWKKTKVNGSWTWEPVSHYLDDGYPSHEIYYNESSMIHLGCYIEGCSSVPVAAEVYNDTIYIFMDNGNECVYSLLKWNDETRYTLVPELIEWSNFKLYPVMHQGKMHFIGGGTSHITGRDTLVHYIFDFKTETITKLDDVIGISVTGATPVSINNEIHMLGGSTTERQHVVWDGIKWYTQPNIPIDMNGEFACVTDDLIHLFKEDNFHPDHITVTHYVGDSVFE